MKTTHRKTQLSLIAHRIQQYFLATNETAVVETRDGKVKGLKRITIYNDSYYSFEGIPFAKPPISELRFKAPQPSEPWEGIRDCTNYAYKPVQFNVLTRFVEGSEDCLYLNVFMKKLHSEKPLPVMVYIYGGGYEIGEASRDLYSPDYFMMEDIVLVTISYRVGVFGFLSLEDPTLNVPGNAGLKDQVLALKWIKNNIRFFNGDPNNITVFGESAGAVSTHLMMITEQTTGLFHKAIIQSGCALAEWSFTLSKHLPYRLATSLGYKGEENDKHLFEFLGSCSARKLAYAQKTLLNGRDELKRTLLIFAPVIEPYVTADCVVPQHPREMMRTAWSNNIPMIIGACSAEGLFIFDVTKKKPELLNTLGDCRYIVPDELCPNSNTDLGKELGLRLKKAFFGDREPSMEHMYAYLDMMSFKLIWHPVHRTILSRLEYASAATYIYRFDFDSTCLNFMRLFKCGRGYRGVCHADDLAHLFHCALSPKLHKDSPEYINIYRMIGMWTNFAQVGDPNTNRIKPAIWKPVDKCENRNKCLNISQNIEFVELPESKKCEIWDSLYTKDLF